MNTLLKFIFFSTPFKYYVQSFWRDEAFSYLLAKQNMINILLLTAKDFNPPLYYLLLHWWMIFFGSSEMAIRTLSFVFFLVTLYIIGLFFIEIFKISIKKTFIYLLLFVLNPVLHYYAFEARMYSLFAFLASLSFYFLYKKQYRKYAFTVILGLFTHYFMFFALLGQIFFLFATDKKNLRKHSIMFIKIAIYYVPWILVVAFSKTPFAGQFWIPSLNIKTVLNIPGILFTGHEQFMGFPYWLLPIISLLLVGIFMATPKANNNKHMAVFLFSWFILPLFLVVAFSLFKPIFLPRYIIFITIGLLLSVVYVLERYKARTKMVLFILLLLFSFHYSLLQVFMRNKEDIKKPLLEIKKMLGKDDVVYVTHEFNFHPAQYYINEKQVYIYNKTYEEIPVFVGKVLIPQNKITNTLPIYPRKAFIFKDDLSYSIKALY